MNQSKLFFYLAVFNVAIAVLIIADCHFLPRKEIKEKYDYESHVESRTKSGRYYTTYFVCKSGRKYQVPDGFYLQLNKDSSLEIEQSIIFQMPLSICSPSEWSQNRSCINQIDNSLIFITLMIAWFAVSLYVIVRKKTISNSGTDLITLSVIFYIGFLLILM
jgi:hypothetical protein